MRGWPGQAAPRRLSRREQRRRRSRRQPGLCPFLPWTPGLLLETAKSESNLSFSGAPPLPLAPHPCPPPWPSLLPRSGSQDLRRHSFLCWICFNLRIFFSKRGSQRRGQHSRCGLHGVPSRGLSFLCHSVTGTERWHHCPGRGRGRGAWGGAGGGAVKPLSLADPLNQALSSSGALLFDSKDRNGYLHGFVCIWRALTRVPQEC